MRKVLTVARREYIETVRTKTFIFGMLLAPVLMALFVILPAGLAVRSVTEERPARRVAVINSEPGLEEALGQAFASYNSSTPGRQILVERTLSGRSTTARENDDLKSRVRDGGLDALLVIERGIVDGEAGSTLYTHNVSEVDFYGRVRGILDRAVRNVRYANSGISPETARRINAGVPLEQVDLESGTVRDSDRMASMMVPFAFMFLMFMGIFTTGSGLLNSVIEEKSTRVIEVLLAAVTPFELMTGKILGESAIGLTLLAFYGLVAGVSVAFTGISLPLSTVMLITYPFYFVLGFLLFASLFAAGGSAVNSVQETKSLMGPITMIAILPMMAWFYIAQNPSGAISVALSMIPPLTPMVMALRLAVEPSIPAWQVVISLLLLGASVLSALWAASRIFRIGVLMYGKPPSPRELLRWIRQA